MRLDLLGASAKIRRAFLRDPSVADILESGEDHSQCFWTVRMTNGTVQKWSREQIEDIPESGIKSTSKRRKSSPASPAPPASPVPLAPLEPPSPITPPDDVDLVDLEAVRHYILSHHPELEDWENKGHLIVYGPVQVGKTSILMAMIWLTRFIHGMTPVLILANMDGSYRQVLCKDVRMFNEKIVQKFGEHASKPFLLGVEGLRHRPEEVDIEDNEFLLIMSNPSQLRTLVRVVTEKVEQNPDQKFGIFSDEADVHIKSTDDDEDVTKTGPLYRQLQDLVARHDGFMVDVTATPFALWNRKGAVQRSMSMTIPQDYRGPQQMEWKIVENPVSVRKNTAGALYHLLNEMVGTIYPRAVEARLKFISVLVNVASTHTEQARLVQQVIRKANTGKKKGGEEMKWEGFVMNSSDTCLIKQVRGVHGRLEPMGIDFIGNLYDHWERESLGSSTSGPAPMKIKIIFAGMTAGRAVSFRPTSKSIGTSGLNGMVYLSSTRSHMASVLQAQRAFGRYHAEHPKILVATTLETKQKLFDEVFANFPALVKVTREEGETRQKMEGVQMLDVGLHDRKAVDDTHLTNRVKLRDQDFESEEAVRAFLVGNDQIHEIRVMTEGCMKIPLVEFPDFSYEMKGGKRDRFRKEVQERFPEKYRDSSTSFQVCWTEKRFGDQHSMRHRFAEKNKGYRPVCVGGCPDPEGENKEFTVVFWKQEYSEEDSKVEDIEGDGHTAFLYQTSDGGMWRFYFVGENRKVGIIAH